MKDFDCCANLIYQYKNLKFTQIQTETEIFPIKQIMTLNKTK